MDNGQENVSLVRAFFRKTWVRVVLAIDIIAILVVVFVAVENAKKTAVVEFIVAPVEAEISLNGNSGYQNGGLYKIAPGKYNVQVSYEGLDTKNLEMEVGANDSVTMAVYLTKDGEFDFYELKENYMDYEQLKEIAPLGNNRTWDEDKTAGAFIFEFEKALGIFEELPITEITTGEVGRGLVVVESGEDIAECEKTLCLLVVDLAGVTEDYLSGVVKDAGYNIKNYQVVYGEASDEED